MNVWHAHVHLKPYPVGEGLEWGSEICLNRCGCGLVLYASARCPDAFGWKWCDAMRFEYIYISHSGHHYLCWWCQQHRLRSVIHTSPPQLASFSASVQQQQTAHTNHGYANVTIFANSYRTLQSYKWSHYHLVTFRKFIHTRAQHQQRTSIYSELLKHICTLENSYAFILASFSQFMMKWNVELTVIGKRHCGFRGECDAIERFWPLSESEREPATFVRKWAHGSRHVGCVYSLAAVRMNMNENEHDGRLVAATSGIFE